MYKVIIPAAGQGKRMGAGKNKLLLQLKNVPVLIHTLQVFDKDPQCDGIVLAIHPQDEATFTGLIKEYGISKVTSIVYGGEERQHSIHNALKILSTDGIVMVHDAARPFINHCQIHELETSAGETGAAVLAVPVKDTIKKVFNNIVSETVERSSLWAIQTPQAFRISLLKDAYDQAEESQFVGTDDASLVERLPHPVHIVEGDYDNIKLTTPEDLYFAEAIIQKRKMVLEKEQ